MGKQEAEVERELAVPLERGEVCLEQPVPSCSRLVPLASRSKTALPVGADEYALQAQ